MTITGKEGLLGDSLNPCSACSEKSQGSQGWRERSDPAQLSLHHPVRDSPRKQKAHHLVPRADSGTHISGLLSQRKWDLGLGSFGAWSSKLCQSCQEMSVMNAPFAMWWVHRDGWASSGQLPAPSVKFSPALEILQVLEYTTVSPHTHTYTHTLTFSLCFTF
jgi:hypothetical protein